MFFLLPVLRPFSQLTKNRPILPKLARFETRHNLLKYINWCDAISAGFWVTFRRLVSCVPKRALFRIKPGGSAPGQASPVARLCLDLPIRFTGLTSNRPCNQLIVKDYLICARLAAWVCFKFTPPGPRLSRGVACV